jgi:hypothetical protein
VIGYDHGGVGETLRLACPEGRVPVGDIDALEAVTRKLLERPAEVSPQAFTTIQEMVDQTVDLYQALLRA